MTPDDHLASAEILDCRGRSTHRLVLEVDGIVRIDFLASGRTARVDPTRRRNLTPHVPVSEQLIAHAAGLTPW